MTLAGILCAAVFVAVFALIATERVHKTKAALAGAVLVILVGFVDQHTAFHGEPRGPGGVDWNTIFLLIGMMIIVNISRRTGMFQWLAIRAAKAARGSPFGILALLAVITAVVSACLDNVTTVLIVAPVAILICETLEIDPVPYLISVILASNIGGASTLVGHPPNIMIASATGFDFLDFLRVDAPIAALALAVFLLGCWLLLRRSLRVEAQARARIMEFEEARAITDQRLLRRCLLTIGLTLIGFFLHGMLGLEPATIALAGAALLLLLHPEGPQEVLAEIEWPTIFFFIGLFVMVSGLVETGVIAVLGHGMLNLAQGSIAAMALGILWLSGVACGIMDHIPYAAAMIPLIQNVSGSVPAGHQEVLWWALSLGANLGANMTIIAAATNVVVAGVAERSGYPIPFRRFLKYGVPVTLANLVLSTLYLWLRFLH